MAAGRSGGNRSRQRFAGHRTEQTKEAERTGKLLHPEDKVYLPAQQALFAHRYHSANRDHAEMQCDSEAGGILGLHLFEGSKRRHDIIRSLLILSPVSEKAVAEILVNYAMMLIDDLFAGGDPAPHQRGQLVAYHAPAERGKVFDVGHQKPARDVCGLAHSLLGHGRPELVKDFGRLPKGKHHPADHDLVHVAKPDRLMDPAFVQKGPVAAAQIDQPKLAGILQIDDGVAARNLRRIQNDRALGRSA
jgi:hypothetical protein